MKERKRMLRSFVVFFLLLAVALTGCGKYNNTEKTETTKPTETKGSGNPDVFNFATNQDIPHLDPHGTAANTSFRITYMMYERLVTYDGTSTDVKPQLAEKWDISPDGKEFTFYLRKDAKFHDGTPVTAEAVKYSLTRAIKVGKSAAGEFKDVLDVNGLEVVNDNTIKIKLTKPFVPFLKALGTVYANIINPKLKDNEGSDLGQTYLADKDMGSGPYVLESWDRGQKLVLKANDSYWGGKPKLQKVNIMIIPEPATARLMLEKGEIDLVDNTMISPNVLEQMDGKNDIRVVKSPGFQIDDIAMNMTKGPLQNVKVRQALSHAVNYDSIIKDILGGGAERVGGIVPKGMFGYNANTKLYDYNLDKAKALLKEAGYDNNLTLEIAISENNEVRKNIAVMLQADLAKIGVKLNIKQLAWPTFLELVTSGGHELALAAWTPDYADPDYNLWYFAHSSSKGPGFNLAFFDNKEVDGLLAEARGSVDEAKRKQAYEKVQDIMAEQAPYIFVAQRSIQAPVKTWVEGYEMNPMNTWYVPFQKMTKK